MGHSVNWMMSGSCLHHSFNFDQHLMTTSQGYYIPFMFSIRIHLPDFHKTHCSLCNSGGREREREM